MQHNEQTQTCAHLMRSLTIEHQREQCINTLGGYTPHEVTANANALLNKAQTTDIINTIKKVEGIKGKCYAAIRLDGATPVPYAGIPETLQQAIATQEELAIWYDQIIKTSFANGTKYQPLPSHDEAWQTFFRVRSELTAKRYAAEQWIYTLSRTPEMTDADITLAARWGFWQDCPITVRRRLFYLLPPETRLCIVTRQLGATQRMQAVEAYYNNPATIT
jgi:hypothetical protein